MRWWGRRIYREVMRPQGWRHGAALCFWTDPPTDFPFFVLTLYRTERQLDFSDANLRVLHYVHPCLVPAVDRFHQSARLDSAEAGLDLVLRHVRGGMVVLDWQLRVVKSSVAGRHACAAWDTTAIDEYDVTPGTIELPVQILRACQALRRSTINALRKRLRARPPRRRAAVTSGRGVNATITVVCGDSEMAEPGFVVEFEHSPRSRQAPVSPRLALLTPSEVHVATLVANGHSNQEVGRATRQNDSRREVPAPQCVQEARRREPCAAERLLESSLMASSVARRWCRT